jgi:hypothetical protein
LSVIGKEAKSYENFLPQHLLIRLKMQLWNEVNLELSCKKLNLIQILWIPEYKMCRGVAIPVQRLYALVGKHDLGYSGFLLTPQKLRYKKLEYFLIISFQWSNARDFLLGK